MPHDWDKGMREEMGDYDQATGAPADVPGVLRYILFVGGTLNGERRPIAMHGRQQIDDGSTYNRLVPVDETWAYSAERDQYELVEPTR